MTTHAALVWIVLGTGLACTTPAMAQTYDPNYPVCMEIAEWGAGTLTAVSPRLHSAKRRVQDGARHAPQIHISRRVCSQRGGAEFQRLAFR